MANLEVTTLTADGVTVTPISELSIGDEIETSLALAAGDYTLACVVCLVPIKSGMGHCYCERHIPTNRKRY